MRRNVKILVSSVAVLNDVAMLSTLFFTFVSAQTKVNMLLGPWLWAGCVLVWHWVNLAFLRKPRSIPQVVLLNLIGAVVLPFAVLRWDAEISGPVVTTIAVIVLLITVIRAWYFAITPITLVGQITKVDGLVICMLWYGLVCSGGIFTSDRMLLFLVLAFLLELVVLAIRRGAGEQSEVLYGAKGRGILLSAGLLCAMGLFIFLLIRLLAKGSRALVEGVVSGVGAGVSWLGYWLNVFLEWLSSLIPYEEEMEAIDMGQISMGEMEAAEELGLAINMKVVAVILGIAALAAISLGIWLLFRFRKVKLGKIKISAPAAPTGKSRRTGSLGRWLRALLAELRFRWLSLVYRGTPEGTLVFLEHWGKQHGFPRKAGETPGTYFRRLAQFLPEEEREEGMALLSALAENLNARFFGGGRQTSDYPTGDGKRLRALFRGVKREKPETEKRDEKIPAQ